MTANDLKKIEAALGIKLPAEYRDAMTARGDELAAKSLPGIKKATPFFRDNLYLKPKKLVSVNQQERDPGMGTGSAFPGWEKTFVLIGDNGGGDYYCLRLDNTPGVFQIGSDCGDEPTRLFPSLTEYIVDQLRLFGDALQENQAQLRETPPPGQSSFNPSCPPRDRVAFYLSAGPVSGNARIVFQGDDIPLTNDLLTARGINLNEICRAAAVIATILLRAPSNTITADAEADEDSPVLNLSFGKVPGENFNRGYWYVALMAAGTGAQVDFHSLVGNPAPTEISLDWEKLKAALAALLKSACPGKVSVHMANPGPVAVRKDRLVYVLPYTIAE